MLPEVAEKILGRTSNERAKLNHYKRFKIYFHGQELFYPALVQQAASITEGKLIRNLSTEELALADEYEGNEYERKLVQVELIDGSIDAWCYVWKANTEFILKDEWYLDDFKEKYLSDFLAGRL